MDTASYRPTSITFSDSDAHTSSPAQRQRRGSLRPRAKSHSRSASALAVPRRRNPPEMNRSAAAPETPTRRTVASARSLRFTSSQRPETAWFDNWSSRLSVFERLAPLALVQRHGLLPFTMRDLVIYALVDRHIKRGDCGAIRDSVLEAERQDTFVQRCALRGAAEPFRTPSLARHIYDADEARAAAIKETAVGRAFTTKQYIIYDIVRRHLTARDSIARPSQYAGLSVDEIDAAPVVLELTRRYEEIGLVADSSESVVGRYSVYHLAWRDVDLVPVENRPGEYDVLGLPCARLTSWTKIPAGLAVTVTVLEDGADGFNTEVARWIDAKDITNAPFARSSLVCFEEKDVGANDDDGADGAHYSERPPSTRQIENRRRERMTGARAFADCGFASVVVRQRDSPECCQYDSEQTRAAIDWLTGERATMPTPLRVRFCD